MAHLGGAALRWYRYDLGSRRRRRHLWPLHGAERVGPVPPLGPAPLVHFTGAAALGLAAMPRRWWIVRMGSTTAKPFLSHLGIRSCHEPERASYLDALGELFR